VDPDGGRILLDGIDLRDLARGELASSVAIVPQTAFLFDDTVRGNVTLGAEWITDDRCGRRCARPRPTGSWPPCPTGSTPGWGARHVAVGGQRQRISLARALVRRPRLLILDDATSAVDPEVEARILEALRSPASGTTVGADGRPTLLVVAYRKATIGLADEVVHLEDGRVADRGTHAELLERSPSYSRLVNAYEHIDHTELAGEPHERRDHRAHVGTRMDTGEELRALETIRRGVRHSPELKEGIAGTLVLGGARLRRPGRRPDRRPADAGPRARQPRRARRPVHRSSWGWWRASRSS
jgi:ABC-type multidrug transport system ATPase subunit